MYAHTLKLMLLWAALFLCFANNAQPLVGAAQTDRYLHKLENKRVGLVVNQTSKVGSIHIVDFLLSKAVNISTIFAPEHGFRGNQDAGAHIENSVDATTGIPIVSLYGRHKKPSPQDLAQLDFLIFDIQDVGARFYTYISTLHLVMEACAEEHIPLLILDRPNPNGFYVDGPVLELPYRSFVGMHTVPVVHGMTVGEYAQMVNQEGWLNQGIKASLEVITCKGYDHTTRYKLPIKPSPNLPTAQSILLYPSLCFFEGTYLSAGRGTPHPFETYGAPDLQNSQFSFTPVSTPGAARYPKFEEELCYGEDLRKHQTKAALDLSFLLRAYKSSPRKGTEFFNAFFTKLAGTKRLQQQIEAGKTASEIRASWQEDLQAFKKLRRKYLMYKDFE